MHTDRVPPPGEAPVVLRVEPGRLDGYRLMLREQIEQDRELRFDVLAGCADYDLEDLRERTDFLWSLAFESVRPESGDLIVRVPSERLNDFRYMLREQVAGDSELLRFMDGGEAVATTSERASVGTRVDLVWDLADQLGGIF